MSDRDVCLTEPDDLLGMLPYEIIAAFAAERAARAVAERWAWIWKLAAKDHRKQEAKLLVSLMTRQGQYNEAAFDIQLRDQQIAALRESLAGMVESYEVLMGEELRLPPLARDVVKGVFLGEMPRARALLEGKEA